MSKKYFLKFPVTNPEQTRQKPPIWPFLLCCWTFCSFFFGTFSLTRARFVARSHINSWRPPGCNIWLALTRHTVFLVACVAARVEREWWLWWIKIPLVNSIRPCIPSNFTPEKRFERLESKELANVRRMLMSSTSRASSFFRGSRGKSIKLQTIKFISCLNSYSMRAPWNPAKPDEECLWRVAKRADK